MYNVVEAILQVVICDDGYELGAADFTQQYTPSAAHTFPQMGPWFGAGT